MNFHENKIFLFVLILIGFFISSCGGTFSQNRPIKPHKSNLNLSFGLPYRVQNKTYYPLKKVGSFTQEGIASWYGPKFHGKQTSNKETYDMHALTAAHKTLPFDARVQVLNLENGKKVNVRINDRGPFINNRIIDLSYAAASKLEITNRGTASVRLTVLNPTAENFKNLSNTIQLSKYSIQVGVFKELINAQVLEQSVSESRTDVVIKQGDRFYRVLVGDFDQYEKAVGKLEQLHLKGHQNAFIVFP